MSTLADLYVVSHTHWDREWYHTAARFRQRLVALVDDLLDNPPSPDSAFLLDGQAILLDDYLAVRGDRRAGLAKLLGEGRIEAGPWYVLADELIPSGEALVRNLQLGRATVEKLGGTAPPVLYCPDSFGHPAALPELAAGFGASLIVLWRGFGGDRSAPSDVVRWRSASGASALVYHLPPDGYEFGSSLPVDVAAAQERWGKIQDVLAPRALSGVALLLNGADHHARQAALGDALAALSRAAGPTRVHPASLSTAARELVEAIRDTALPEVSGELRDSYGYTWTLQGTFGTRAAQKRRNARAERSLVRDVEPWMALLPDLGDGTKLLLMAAWRTLLAAHPHDTLCGTSIDAVASAFEETLASVEAQVAGLRHDVIMQLIGHDPDTARRVEREWKDVVLVRNPAARARGGIVELRLESTVASVAVGPGSATRQGERKDAAVPKVAGMALQVLGEAERVALTESSRAYPLAHRVRETAAVGWTGPLRGYSVESRAQRDASVPEVPNPVTAGDGVLENALLRVEVGPDGQVVLHDTLRKRTIRGLLSFECERDVGDLYTPAIREPLAAPVFTGARMGFRGPIRGRITLDFHFSAASPGTQASMCSLELELDADSPVLRVHVRGTNNDANQRLRIRFATQLPNAATVADAAFLPVVREVLIAPDVGQSMEQVVPTAPLHRWVARFAANDGVVVVSDGLAEYESLANGDVAITLVRSVGELSRADLPERPGHAGWPAATPGAQSLGPYEATFHFACIGGDVPATRDAIERLAEDALSPLAGETLRSYLGEEGTWGGLELEGEGLACRAVLPAQERGWTVLRCVNQGSARVEGRWVLRRQVSEATLARLDETPLTPLAVSANAIAFTAGAFEVVTILAR